MQRVLSRQIFTTKIFFVVNWEQRPSSASCQRHELPSYLPITKDSPSSLPFRTFFWVIKNQKKGSPTVSACLPDRPPCPTRPLVLSSTVPLATAAPLVRGEKALHQWVTEPKIARWSRDTWPEKYRHDHG